MTVDVRGYDCCLHGSALDEDDPHRCHRRPTYQFIYLGPSGASCLPAPYALACEEHREVLEEWSEPGVAGLRREVIG